MKAFFSVRFVSLLVLVALLVPTLPTAEAASWPLGGKTGKHRVGEHRPNYKKYKGKRTHPRAFRILHLG
ncbi:hypothetical protein GCM10022408_05680 [Hymenobacter fastidiosus]|uniref:Uncharacterized protein n=1 Tax=Hymenobacter fastidiosus TaxID=486264 RepID=A0ABP7RJ51_9BACT